MKRFNTDRIRQRMREQNERFPPSKGKLLSSAPIRIALPPQTGKENSAPVATSMNANVLNGPNNTNNNTNNENNIRTKKFPQLSISVTMSEAEDDEGSYNAVSIVQNESTHVSDDEDNNTVQSVWAMMEHYQGTSKDSFNGSGSNEQTLSKKSLDSEVKPKVLSEKIDDTESIDAVRIPTRIHWLEDEDGELMQSSFYTHGEESEIGNVETMEISTNNATDLSTTREDDKCVIFRRDTTAVVNDQAVSPRYSSNSNDQQGQGQPTPARVRQEWVDSEDDEDISTNPGSLLQESMIQSIQLSSHGDSRAAAEISSNLSTHRMQNDNETQLSLASLPESKSVSKFEGSGSTAAQEVTKHKV